MTETAQPAGPTGPVMMSPGYISIKLALILGGLSLIAMLLWWWLT